MKAKSLAAILLSIFTLMACKKNRSSAGTGDNAEFSETYDIIVDLIIDTDDVLIVYYKDGGNQWFVEEKTVWAGVKANPDVQQVTFSMPEDVVPNDIRLDIGRNEFKEKTLEIKKVAIRYKGKRFEIPQDQLMNFFSPNQFIVYDEATRKFTFKTQASEVFDPFFESTPELYPQLVNVAM